MKNIKVYYAHSKTIYDTAREKEELTYLRKQYKEVIDPNSDLGELGHINEYLKKITLCDMVICSETDSGHLSKGTFTEVVYAFNSIKPVKCIKEKKGKLILLPVLNISIVNGGTDWNKYGKIYFSKKA